MYSYTWPCVSAVPCIKRGLSSLRYFAVAYANVTFYEVPDSTAMFTWSGCIHKKNIPPHTLVESKDPDLKLNQVGS